MRNIRIAVEDSGTIAVIADTKEHGRNAVVYEGQTFRQCCDYIREKCRRNNFRLVSASCMRKYTDAEGETMPWVMDVRL